MMKEETAYTAVPTSLKDDKVALAPPRRRFKILRAIAYVIVIYALVGLLVDDDDHESHGRRHHRHNHHRMSHHGWWNYDERHPGPTKLPGGGRDWLLNVEEKTIVAKHNPSLVLGIETSFPLVLTRKGSPNQLLFGPPPTDESEVVPLVSKSGLGVVVDDKQHIGNMHYRETKLVQGARDKDLVTVSYPQHNFIALESFKSWCAKHKMVLEVAFWSLTQNSKVSFVEGPSWDSFQAGGGRDFVWNKDGTISTKLNPSLVLGKAAPRLVLVGKDSPNKLVLENVEDLANGKTVPMTTVDGRVVNTLKDAPQEFGPWQYMESQVSNEGDAVSIHYDGNYILLDNDQFALDVSFWDMDEGTTVAFVGGINDQDFAKTVSARGISGSSSSSDDSSSSSDDSASSSDDSSSSSDDSASSSDDSSSSSDSGASSSDDSSSSLDGSASSSDDSSSSSDGSASSEEVYLSDVDVEPVKVKTVPWLPGTKQSVNRLRGGH